MCQRRIPACSAYFPTANTSTGWGANGWAESFTVSCRPHLLLALSEFLSVYRKIAAVCVFARGQSWLQVELLPRGGRQGRRGGAPLFRSVGLRAEIIRENSELQVYVWNGHTGDMRGCRSTMWVPGENTLTLSLHSDAFRQTVKHACQMHVRIGGRHVASEFRPRVYFQFSEQPYESDFYMGLKFLRQKKESF